MSEELYYLEKYILRRPNTFRNATEVKRPN